MSLLGRLEDLSLTDIIQIVFLSRRTGILEIIDSRGRHTVLFHHGLIVNASSPESPSLREELERRQLVDAEAVALLKQMEEAGVAPGVALLDMNLLRPEALAEVVQKRVTDVVTPLLASRDGEFNFILSDSIGHADIEYDPDTLFREGGIQPQKILGGAEGEKIKPLRGLEETMRAGKALLRGATAPAPSPQLDIGLAPLSPEADEPLSPEMELPMVEGGPADLGARAPAEEEDEAPFGELEPAGGEASLDDLLTEPPDALGALEPAPEPAPPAADPLSPPLPTPTPPSPSVAAGKFRIAESQSEAAESIRNAVVFERDPLIRVAAKRAFAKKKIASQQFGSIEDAKTAIGDHLRRNRFFVTFLEIDSNAREDVELVRVLQGIKKRNRHLPVVVVDGVADLRRRHALLKQGADLYLTKPPEDRLQPDIADEELALFADELVLFSERAFADWEQLTGTFVSEGKPGQKFYDLAERERINRSFDLLKMLINELSNPNDIGQVSLTIMRLAAEYLDRGVLFMVSPTDFIGLGGFGSTGGGEEMNSRVRKIRISRAEPSVLGDVTEERQPRRGKLRRTPANEELIRRLGSVLPTEVAVLPIVNRDRVVGLLYGDNAESRAPIDLTTGLEIFLEQAGFAFHNALIASSRRHDLEPG